MRKIFLKSKKKIKKKPKQRKTLFIAKFKIEGKCCNFIINSGSSENLVSTLVVNKLNLKRTPLLEAYRVLWLQRGKGLL